MNDGPHGNGLPTEEEDQLVDSAAEEDRIAEGGESSKSRGCHFLKGKNQLQTKPRTLLPTAMVFIAHPSSSGGEFRDLVDPGSEVNIFF